MNPQSLIAPDRLHELAQTARACPAGDIVEVGVYKGGSAAILAHVAKEQGRRLFLFDTFNGIPHAGRFDRHAVGDFGDTSIDEVRKAVPEAIIVQGIFPGTLAFVSDLGPIALAHIDCDQYQSVRDCCFNLGPLMGAGGVMVFDDYDALPGARRAVEEIFDGRVEISRQGKARVRF